MEKLCELQNEERERNLKVNISLIMDFSYYLFTSETS